MSEKVIILDFDVPATNMLTALATGSPFELNPTVMRILNNVCAASGARLVCSSNRAPLDKKAETEELLRRSGFDPAYLHEDWSCSYENTYSPDIAESVAIRSMSIAKWTVAHPDVEFAVLDDLPLLVSNFVHIKNRENGIQFEDIQKVCAILSIDLQDVAKVANPGARSRIKFPAYKPQ